MVENGRTQQAEALAEVAGEIAEELRAKRETEHGTRRTVRDLASFRIGYMMGVRDIMRYLATDGKHHTALIDTILERRNAALIDTILERRDADGEGY